MPRSLTIEMTRATITKVRRDTQRPQYLNFCTARGNVIISVHEDYLFDCDGNYFNTDTVS